MRIIDVAKVVRVVVSLMTIYSGLVSADDDYEFIYQLGGASAIGSAASNRDQTVRIGGGVGWNTDLMCGNFDINLSIQNQLNGVSGAFQNLMDNVINAASGVVASLPALVLQRLNPALYDLLQNGILQASEEFHLGEISCKKIVEGLKTSNGGEGWDAMAVGRYWANASQAPEQDILLVEEAADEEGMNAGIPWLNGEERGGLDQPPIEVVKDTTVAGYNLLLNREANRVFVAQPSTGIQRIRDVQLRRIRRIEHCRNAALRIKSTALSERTFGHYRNFQLWRKLSQLQRRA